MRRGVPQGVRSTIADNLNTLLTNTTVGANLHAYSNVFTPSPLAVIGDFTECTFPGYAKKTALTGWAKAFDSASGSYRCYQPTQQVFTAGTLTATQTVAGVYVTDSTDATLYGWMSFDSPLVMRALNDAVIVDVELRIPINALESNL
jgi:hypothetical protein